MPRPRATTRLPRLPVPGTYNHHEMNLRAKRWLLGAGRCKVAFIEIGTTAERPDAIGYGRSGWTRLVEVKTSRSDFLADRKKPWRTDPAKGMGAERFFMTPPNLVTPEELPDGWGLLYYYAETGSIRRVKASRRFMKRNKGGETAILVGGLTRVHNKGFWHAIETPAHEVASPEPQPVPEGEEDILADPTALVAEAEQEVLALPTLATIGPQLAPLYRAGGHQIATRFEDEQAWVIGRLLALARLHGPAWREKAMDEWATLGYEGN